MRWTVKFQNLSPAAIPMMAALILMGPSLAFGKPQCEPQPTPYAVPITVGEGITIKSVEGWGPGCGCMRGKKYDWEPKFFPETGKLQVEFWAFDEDWADRPDEEIYCKFGVTVLHETPNTRLHLYKAQLFGKAKLHDSTHAEVYLDLGANDTKYTKTYTVDQGFVGAWQSPVFTFPEPEDRDCNSTESDIQIRLEHKQFGKVFSKISIGGDYPQPQFFFKLLPCKPTR